EADLSALLTQDIDGSIGNLTNAKVDFLLFAPGNSSTTPDYQKLDVGAASDGTVATTLTGLPGGDYRVVVTIDSQEGRYFSASDATGGVNVIPIRPPLVASQPSDQKVNAGTTASFSATAEGSPTPSVQWQFSTDGGQTFHNVSGATSTTLSLQADQSMSGY